MRIQRAALIGALLALPIQAALAAPFAHLTTDKPTYRLGEAVLFRVHTREPIGRAQVTLEHEGRVVARLEGETGDKKPLAGSFTIPEDATGGAYRLVARAAGVVLHEVTLEVYDVQPRALDVALLVLGDSHGPGETVTATVAARDPATSFPLEGAKVRWRATFGALEVKGEAGPTDVEGLALVRFKVPDAATAPGSLAAGVEHGKRLGAAARPLALGLVGRVDAIPEGGSILPGGKVRLALLVRDPRGEPVVIEGRILDEKGALASLVQTDRRGLALVDLDWKRTDARFSLRVDRPTQSEAFPLPGPTGHALALRTEHEQGRLKVLVRRDLAAAPVPPGELLLVQDGRVVEHHALGLDDGHAAVTFASRDVAGAARVLLRVGGRVLLETPVFVDATVQRVELLPRRGKWLPGELVTIDVHGQPGTDLTVSAVNAGATDPALRGLPDLGARALLAGGLLGAPVEVRDLFAPARESGDRRLAYLVAHGSWAVPPGGIPCAANGLPADPAGALGRFEAAPVASATPLAPNRTAVRAAPRDALDRLVARASFTRHDLPRPAGDVRFERNVSPGELLASPGRPVPPEAAFPWSRVDCRDTRLFVARVALDQYGQGSFSFRIGHEAGPIWVAAEGFDARRTPLAGSVAIQPAAGFSVPFEIPSHLVLGDTFEVLSTPAIEDGGREPIEISIVPPPALKALDRTTLVHDPRSSAASFKLRFEAVAPVASARVLVVAARGLFREVRSIDVSVATREVELTCGRSGVGSGSESLEVKLPANAIAGTVVASARASAGAVATASEGVEELLREPHGCFEQTTSTAYPNLVILDLLEKRGADPALLARAQELATQGFERILTFQDPESGGFSLWPTTREPKARYTALAVAQLSRYGKLFQGRGSNALHRAVAFLEKAPTTGQDGPLVALALAEAGFTWPGAGKVLAAAPESVYEQAQLANLAAAWSGPWPAGLAPRAVYLERALAALEAAQTPAGGLASDGQGVMGSTGSVLHVETTGLAAWAFAAGGRESAARRACDWLAAQRSPGGGWYGTQATVLALRAITRVAEPAPTSPVVVELDAGAGGTATALLGGTRARRVTLSRAIAAGPGTLVKLGLSLKAAQRLDYGISCTYKVVCPEGSARAPYRLATSLPGQLQVGAESHLVVTLAPTGAPLPKGQFVAQIGIPAGCRPSVDLAAIKASRLEERDGQLVLYWEEAPAVSSFMIAVTPTTAGTFASRPAVAYPYYESGRESYAPPLVTKILPRVDQLLGGAALRGR